MTKNATKKITGQALKCQTPKIRIIQIYVHLMLTSYNQYTDGNKVLDQFKTKPSFGNQKSFCKSLSIKVYITIRAVQIH